MRLKLPGIALEVAVLHRYPVLFVFLRTKFCVLCGRSSFWKRHAHPMWDIFCRKNTKKCKEKDLTSKPESCTIVKQGEGIIHPSLTDREGGISMSKNLDVSILMDYYGGMLTEKQRELAELYYNDDLSLGEIAQITGITRQGVHDSIKRTEALLLEYEEHLRLLEKSTQMIQMMEQIKLWSEELGVMCRQAYCPNPIMEQVGKIEQLAEQYLKQYE